MIAQQPPMTVHLVEPPLSVFYENPCRVYQILRGSEDSYRNLRKVLVMCVFGLRQAEQALNSDELYRARFQSLLSVDDMVEGRAPQAGGSRGLLTPWWPRPTPLGKCDIRCVRTPAPHTRTLRSPGGGRGGGRRAGWRDEEYLLSGPARSG
jgi:hypothetical protein